MKNGHPLGKKNTMRRAEETEVIVLEYLSGKEGYRNIARFHNISNSLIRTWISNYSAEGLNGLRSKQGLGKNSGKYNRYPSEIDKLKEELLKKEIEIERLKKGYQVKGDGAIKEYVTTFDVNTKSSKN